MSWQAPSSSGAGNAIETPDDIDDTIQQLAALTISNDESADSDTQVQHHRTTQAWALADAILDRLRVPRRLSSVDFGEAKPFRIFVKCSTFLLSTLRLRDKRLRRDSEDLYGEIAYDPDMNDVKLWIWIWAGADLITTKTRMEEFDTNMNKFIGYAKAHNIDFGQIRVVWRVGSPNGTTYYRQVACWPSETSQHQQLSRCIRLYSADVVKLGWFPAGADRVEMAVKPSLPRYLHDARKAESRGMLVDVDYALGYYQDYP
ncbi:hypothetical protein FHL15_002230 [Xylaria flabelliformis]|uniref:Uncharacterized protein n=1 Tax=Xylaria flabelliformis TaxID=2512241 RepID=A0A553I9P6_9PEZI|nr:hypothetical protein FHL15_002230 [Xylaria flabelliformis]